MLAKVLSCAVMGLDGELIDVEVDRGRGLPSFVLVGLPDAAVKESGQRVEAAIKNSGFVWPRARLTINLAPANLRKEGPAYDLPIALGVLATAEQLPPDALQEALVVGELSLDGQAEEMPEDAEDSTSSVSTANRNCRYCLPSGERFCSPDCPYGDDHGDQLVRSSTMPLFCPGMRRFVFSRLGSPALSYFSHDASRVPPKSSTTR